MVIQLITPAAALLLLDRWSKREVRVRLRGGRIVPALFFQIRFVSNVKRLYQRTHVRIALIVVWFASLISAIALYQNGAWFQSRASLIGLGLAFAGALGNLLDIVRYQCVVDFIDLRWWPVFNLADVGIISGLVIAFSL